jgi:hypothetical protein
MNVDTVTQRVRAEFEEMPGLALTVPQAAKLFGIDADICLRVFEQLIGASFLRRTRGGAIARGDR